MFVTYLTVYSGDKLPPLYFGSTTAKRLASGYHGSVRSQQYRAAWEQELKDHPEMFDTFVVTEHSTRAESLAEEENLQRMFNAVRSASFANMGYARGGFINPGSFSDDVRLVMSQKAKVRGMKKAQIAGAAARTGMKDSEETKARRNTAVSKAHRARIDAMTAEERKIFGAHFKGKPWSAARRAAQKTSKEN